LTGKTRLQNDLLCVEWDVKPYTLTHSLKVDAMDFASGGNLLQEV